MSAIVSDHPSHTPPPIIPKTPQSTGSTPLPSNESLEPLPVQSTQEIQMDSREITPSSPSASASASASSPRSTIGSVSASASASGSGSGSGFTGGESSRSTMDFHVDEIQIQHHGQGQGQGQDKHKSGVDVDKFLKKMEMEKKMIALQQRLELASIKATNGWKDMTIKEIENKLPPTPLRTRKSQLLPSSPITTSPTRSSASTIPYEPPSPSRPWQLIDVLWQPLPPPSHSRYPPSPSHASPKKRSRTDDYDLSQSPSNIHSRLNGLGLPLSPNRTQKSSSASHRRASSSITTSIERNGVGPSSPLRYGFEGIPKKKRSQSHSNPNPNYQRRIVTATTPTTSQDVDAAKALTHMLSSGGLSDDDVLQHNHGTHSKSRSTGLLSAPLLSSMGSQSLPIPEAFQRNGSTSPSLKPLTLPRINSNGNTPKSRSRVGQDKNLKELTLQTPNSNTRHHIPDSSSPPTAIATEKLPRGEEDKNAAELMMFLAHSPSPMKIVHDRSAITHTSIKRDENEDDDGDGIPRPSLGMAARVLFADDQFETSSSNNPPTKDLPTNLA